MDREAWHAAVHGVTKHWTRLSNLTELDCMWEDARVLGSLKSFVSYASQLSASSILHFSYLPLPAPSSVFTVGSGRWLPDRRNYSSWVPLELRNSHLMAVTSFFY